MSIRQRLFGSTVARRIFATFFIASLVPVGLAVALVLTQVRETMELQAHRQLQDLASSSSRIILDRLVGAGALLAYLPGTSSRPPQFEAAWIQTSAGPHALFGEPTPFGEVSIELGQTRLYLSAAGRAVELLLGKNTGGEVLLARIDRRYLWEYSELIGSGLELCVLVAATQTRLSCSPGASVAASATVWEALAREGQGSFELPAGGFEHLAAYRQVPLPAAWLSPPWSIVVSQPKASLLTPLATFARPFPRPWRSV